jgi:hypothetical protein
MEHCFRVSPALEVIEGNRQVACHLYAESTAASSERIIESVGAENSGTENSIAASDGAQINQPQVNEAQSSGQNTGAPSNGSGVEA